jgi:CheY-like chemotaxis protein
MPMINLENYLILVVEDDDLSFLYIEQIFQLTKGKVIRAKNGAEALKKFRENTHFDIILMDIQLPDIEGTLVTKEIRNMNGTIPIIAQTAGRSAEEKDSALTAGCTEVIVKPFNMEELLGAIGRYLDFGD